MKVMTRICIPLIVMGVVVTAAQKARGQQPTKIKGKVTVGVHELDMKSSSLYLIKVQGEGFQPNVTVKNDSLPYVRRDFRERNTFRSNYVPSKDGKQTIYVLPRLFQLRGKGPFDYTMEITEVPLLAKPLLKEDATLGQADPPYKAKFFQRPHHKSYKVMLTAGKYYVIDMMRRGKGFGGIDCYLYLLDANGKEIQSDDDSGAGLNSRIVVRAEKSGAYTIIATGLGNALGDYSIVVRQAK